MLVAARVALVVEVVDEQAADAQVALVVAAWVAAQVVLLVVAERVVLVVVVADEQAAEIVDEQVALVVAPLVPLAADELYAAGVAAALLADALPPAELAAAELNSALDVPN